MEPFYLSLDKQSLKEKVEALYERLVSCNLCPHECKVNRLKGQKGFCKVASRPMISSYGPHFGEESCLVGWGGSGTIFFTYCNMACVYCQNWEISHEGAGQEIEVEDLAYIMLSLQEKGCHNINLVTPTHQIPFILKALLIAREKGLSLPLVYNCGGYEHIETLKILEGTIDIYMPDFKYAEEKIALKLSKTPRYPQIAQKALKEMYRQVGLLRLDFYSIAIRGLLIRHLVLPGDLARSSKILKWIVKELSPYTYVNIMDQYYPCGEAKKYPPLDRMLFKEEYQEVLKQARLIGLKNLDPRNRRFFNH